MSVFAVIAVDQPDVVKTAIEENYADASYRFGATVWFIHDASEPTTREISTRLRIRGGASGAQAAVLQIDAYSGWAPKSAWDFLAQFPEVKADG
jgi:hypothetical protein